MTNKKIIRFKRILAIILLVSSSFFVSSVQAQLIYSITDLGSLGGMSYGIGINEVGQVTGLSTLTNGDTHAFVTNLKGQMIDLGTLGGRYSIGIGINDYGQVVGYSHTSTGETRAFTTSSNGQIFALSGLSFGAGINNSGQIVGSAKSASGETHATVVNPDGQIIDLGLLGGGYSIGTAINNLGQVAGSYLYNAYFTKLHSFVTDTNGQTNDLGGFEDYSVARGLNDSGQVVGYTHVNGLLHAFVLDKNGLMIDLGALGQYEQSIANGINNFGQVTGYSQNFINGDQRAFVTDNGVMRDLNTLLAANVSGWTLIDAYGINDVGQITGAGKYNGEIHAYVLTPISPIPVPAAIWLFSSVLVFFGVLNNKKNIRILKDY